MPGMEPVLQEHSVWYAPLDSEADIKKAYRKLAMKHHPDKGGDEQKVRVLQANCYPLLCVRSSKKLPGHTKFWVTQKSVVDTTNMAWKV
jgi:hypothetical protein